MNKLKFYTSVIVGNTLTFGLKMFTKSAGTSLPGLVSLKVCPDFLAYVEKYTKNGIINITFKYWANCF